MLTERELETLRYAAEGFNNEAIASLLYVEKTTVNAHLNTIYKRLKIKESQNPRVCAVLWYLKNKKKRKN